MLLSKSFISTFFYCDMWHNFGIFYKLIFLKNNNSTSSILNGHDLTCGIVCDNLIKIIYQFLNISKLFISNGHNLSHMV